MWIDQDQNAFINFLDHFTTNELLPFISNNDNKHPQYFNLTETPKQHINLISYDQMSIQKTSPLPSPKRPYTTITNMTSNLFNLDTPSVSVSTHNIGPNLLSISTLNPFLNSDTQQFHNHPSTSQLFNAISSSNPLTSHSIPHTTNSLF